MMIISIMKLCLLFVDLAGIDKQKWKFSQVLLHFYSVFNGIFVMGLVSLSFVYNEKPIVTTDITNALSCFLVVLHVSSLK